MLEDIRGQVVDSLHLLILELNMLEEQMRRLDEIPGREYYSLCEEHWEKVDEAAKLVMYLTGATYESAAGQVLSSRGYLWYKLNQDNFN